MRLIDADALKKEVPILEPNIDFENCGYCDLWDDKQVKAFIDSAPTIDAEPVRRGRDVNYQGDGYCEFKCSLCGVELAEVRGGIHDCGLDGGYFKYCPNCGAKMEGKNEVDY